MISASDDYPLHQTPRPFRDPGIDSNLYDRFFFCGYPTTGPGRGSTYFAVAFGTYPGRNVTDGAFSIVSEGVQRNVRASRIMGNDRMDLSVGPLTVEIIEPLRRLRVRVDAPEAGISADLLFTSRGPAFEEPHFEWKPGNLTLMDFTRMTQNGTWTGFIQTPTTRFEVTPGSWLGTRDRSWGIRPVGPRDPSPRAPDGPALPNYYWLWGPLNFPDLNVIFDVNENSDGSRWHEHASTAPVGDDPSALPVVEGTHTYEIGWRPNTRRADSFSLTITPKAGGPSEFIKLRVLTTFYMMGVGYTHPTWGHGYYVGPNERTHDEFTTAGVDETNPGFNHVQILCEATRADGTIGMGILEMSIRGPHEPSGLRNYVDMHD